MLHDSSRQIAQLPEQSWFRVSAFHGRPRDARQLALLGLFEGVRGQVLAIQPSGGACIAVRGRPLRLTPGQVRCLEVSPSTTPANAARV